MAKETKTIKQTKSEPKPYILLKNPEQTAQEQTYYDQNNVGVTVNINGYHFSLDESMKDTIEFFKSEYGFVEVK